LRANDKIILTAIVGCVWIGATLVGGRVLLKYENGAGEVGVVVNSWPLDSQLQPAKDSLTLVMAVHPQCPCTRASVGELAQVAARIRDKARVFVLFYQPANSGPEWMNTELHRAVAQIPGVTIVPDIDGKEAQRFGAETSGHVFLFDRAGQLLFNGGITASRGHSGDNPGESAIVSLAQNGAAAQARTLVFGCSLHDRNEGSKCLK
jgi:hypothetical protein